MRLSAFSVTSLISILLQFYTPNLTAATVAFDMLGSSSQNLISHTNAYDGAFSSPGDGFQKYQRGLSPTIPFAVLDDSLVSFPPDALGIIDDNNLDEFFGVTDTINGDNSDTVSAEWQFDISGASGVDVSIDMGAMGDFESSDTFTWSASIDGGPSQVLFSASVDEAASQVYILSGGASFTLNDPVLVDNVLLSNELQTFTAAVVGSGSVLTLTLEASTNGGSEAFAFQNILITTGGAEPPPPPPLVKIHDIQGSGATSPLAGNVVTIEGIVVGDFQNNGGSDNGDLNGFYVQEEDSDADSNPATSEGIFVFDGSLGVDVAVGDLVVVTGEVKEFFSLTEISASDVSVAVSGMPLPAITDVNLPVTNESDFEKFEGMLVEFPQSLVISEYFNFDRFGEIVLALPLAGENRPMSPTAMEVPGSPAYNQLVLDIALSRIKLDDGRTVQNPDPAIHPNGSVFDLSNLFRGGDLVTGASGILDYRFSEYKLQPTSGADHSATNPRPVVPYVAGNIKAATFNVLNYFTTLDQGGNLCGPSSLGCRGADNAEEFQRQRDKIISALAELDADVVGLVELENDVSTAVADLVSGINDVVGAGTYAYINTGAIGSDAIKVGFIFKPASLNPVGAYAVLDASVNPLFIDTKNRPALAQTFETTTGAKFTAVVNHFKSKGSACDDVGDPTDPNGQGNCNLTRTYAAQALAQWLATDPTGSADPDVLILGDLNAYDKEDPITTLVSGGYTDLLLQYEGEQAYTYVFDGQFGYLDYALANTTLLPQVTGTAAWHINADEPDILDYNTDFKKDAQDALYEPNAYRSSDHDPVIVGLSLNSPPQCSKAIASQEMLWPVNHKLVDISVLGVTDPDGDAFSLTIDSIMQDEPVNGEDDGNTAPDGSGVGIELASIRAERAGYDGANGRVYHIGFTATDSAGNQCSGSVKVGVPISKGKAPAVDDGALYNATIP